jgi:uncharacterized protein DUF4388
VTELSGTLEGIGLAPLVSFLAGLGKTGRLAIDDGPMGGEVLLEAGQVVGAAFDAERGLPALDAIGLALGKGRFQFTEQDGLLTEHNLTLTSQELRQHLDQLDREQAMLAAAIPSLSAVPRVVVDEADGQDEIGLDRDTLRLLLVIDGNRSVAALARERGLLRTLKQLARLVQLHLVRVEAPNGPTGYAAPVGGHVQPAHMPPGISEARPPDTDADAEQNADRPGGRPPGTWSRWHRGGGFPHS